MIFVDSSFGSGSERRSPCSAGRSPHLNRPFASRTEQSRLVPEERRQQNGIGMAQERHPLLADMRVPQANGPILACGGDRLAVGRKGYARQRFAVTRQDGSFHQIGATLDRLSAPCPRRARALDART